MTIKPEEPIVAAIDQAWVQVREFKQVPAHSTQSLSRRGRIVADAVSGARSTVPTSS